MDHWTWKLGASLFGAMILTQAAKPKSVQTITPEESSQLLLFLENYRSRNGTPIALQDKSILSFVAYKGKPDALSIGVKTAAAQVREALSADRFVFADRRSSMATVPSEVPDAVQLSYVLPEALQMFLYTSPSYVLIASPKGYSATGARLYDDALAAP